METLEKVLAWIGRRLAEPSTWAGIAAAATAVGLSVGSNATVGASVVAALVAIAKAEAGTR